MVMIWNWRPIYCLIHGPKSQETARLRFVRSVITLVVGMALSYLMWKLSMLNFSLVRHSFNSTLLMILVVLTGTAFALSLCVRTLIVLCFVALACQAGRTYLRAMAFAMVIAGPIDNLVLNAGEVARVFVCTSVLTYNLTKTRFDLMAKPFTNTLKGMDQDVDEIRKSFEELHGVLEDVRYAVEQSDIKDKKGGDQVDRLWARQTHKLNVSGPELPAPGEVQERFQRNMENRCKHQLESGHRVCQRVFAEGYRKCTTNFQAWIAKAICWPYRVDLICELDLFGNPDKICDPSQVVPRNFGETYVELLKGEQELFGNSSEISVSYELRDEELAKSHRKSAERTARAFTEDFERRRRHFLEIMGTCELVLCLFMLRVPYASLTYYLRYRREVDFDNIYITDYFRHVDRRRREKKGPDTILPLRTYEKAMYIDLDRKCTLTAQESKTNVFVFLRLFLEMFTAFIFILFDRIVVELLQIIRQRSLIRYHQKGEHEVRFNITGVGKMAQLLRITMQNFNIHEFVSTSLSNEECLPNAHVLPRSFYYWLLLLYLIIAVLLFQSHLLMRLRRVTCAYFYYKREKHRILYLYNRILRQRFEALQNLVRNVEDNMGYYHVSKGMNPLLRLRFAFPRAFGWLRHCSCAKLSCLICCDPEDSAFILCHSCQVPYCHTCADEMNNICIICEAILSHHHGEESADDDSSIDLYVQRKQKKAK